MNVRPLLAQRQDGIFDLYGALAESLAKNNTTLQNGDIIVISTKYVSVSQGRILDLDRIHPSEQGRQISEQFQLSPATAEIILRESEEIFGGIPGFVITTSDMIMAPNAGIDRSNAGKKAILYPSDPFHAAEMVRRKIFLDLLVRVGVILVDSRIMPARVGTSGVAVSCAGLEPVLDMRAKKDLHGEMLRVTFQATADNLATIANHAMGEGAESQPFAVIRDSGAVLTDRMIHPSEMAVSAQQCVYVRGLSHPALNSGSLEASRVPYNVPKDGVIS